jgi:hypothetical protein
MVQLTFTRGSQAKIEWMEAINMHASDPLPEPFPLPDLTVLRWLETDPDQYMQRDFANHIWVCDKVFTWGATQVATIDLCLIDSV